MTADLFHVGHLNAIANAYQICDQLYIGLLTDKAINKYKGKPPIIPYEERKLILRYVLFPLRGKIYKQKSINPLTGLKKTKADIMFSGDGFTKEEVAAADKLGVGKLIFKYCEQTSTTKIKERVIKIGRAHV